jgi:hypothetical protein
MEANAIEKRIESVNGFNLNVELKELNTNGIVSFHTKKHEIDNYSLWNGQELKVPVYGVYKISWGFYQNAINTFYKDHKTELSLKINNNIYEEKAVIHKQTPSFHAIKESHNTLTVLLREKETLSLNAHTFNGETSKIKDVYLKVEKLNTDDNGKCGYM